VKGQRQEVDQVVSPQVGVARGWASPPGAEAGPWPPSVSSSVFAKPVKIGGLAFISSNSENISCVTFLKHKNIRKQKTGTVASC
jgi:hypothetical protein